MKTLHVVSSLDAAGVPNVIMAYLRRLPADEFEADFIVHGDKVGVLEAEVLERGSRIFHVAPRKASLFRNLLQMWVALSDGDYDVIHSHLNFSSVFPLWLARLKGTPVRIAHAHGSFEPRGPLGRAWHTLARFAVVRLATDFFSCSEVSGYWLFGRRWRAGARPSYLMRNAIDVEQLVSSASAVPEDFWRSDEQHMRLIAVGRLSTEKNHMFLLDVARALRLAGAQFELVIAGAGPLQSKLQVAIEIKGLERDVRLLGARRDVGAWLGAADVCLMPSVREGLGLALIEAQALGVPCIASTGVPGEADLTGDVQFVPLKVGLWVDAIRAEYRPLRGPGKTVAESGYDIQTAAPEYAEHMRELVARTDQSR